MRILRAALAAFFMGGSTAGAFAFSCTVSADKSTVVVKVSNPYPQDTYCTVNCHFKVPGGMTSVSCTKTVPASAQDWVLCERPTNGDDYSKFDSGNEECIKP